MPVFKPMLCWFATASTGVLIVAWVMTIWCTMRWTFPTGRWCEVSEGRISSGQSRPETEFTDFDILARHGPITMRWGFDRDDRRSTFWAIPIWAPLAFAAAVSAWAWRGTEAYSR